MDYTISVSGEGKYILLKVKGDITRQSAMEMNLEAHALGRKMGIRNYLVDVTESRNVDSVVENYEFAYVDMRKMEGIDRLARVATVVSPGDHSHDFMKIVASNAGLNVNLFTDMEEAKQFLLTGQLPSHS